MNLPQVPSKTILPPCLYMVLLGGRHLQARIEVHDVVLAIGTDLDSIKPQLKQLWFGARKGLHIDAWARIHQVSYVYHSDVHQSDVHQPCPPPEMAHLATDLGAQSSQQQYRVQFADVPAPKDALKLFFVNIGGVLPQQFGEQHRYKVLAAFSAAEAKRLALNWARRFYNAGHVDALCDVDDCMTIDLLAGRYVHLQPIATDAPIIASDTVNAWQNCYLPI